MKGAGVRSAQVSLQENTFHISSPDATQESLELSLLYVRVNSTKTKAHSAQGDQKRNPKDECCNGHPKMGVGEDRS